MAKDEEVGCLWIKTGARGEYFAGKIGDQAVVAFRNDKKKNPREPDYRILKAKPREDGPGNRTPHDANAKTERDGSEIPF